MTAAGEGLRRRVIVGQVVGLHGLQGWLKVHSFTEPRERIASYAPLHVGEAGFDTVELATRGRSLLLRLPGLEDRTAVEALVGRDIWIRREQLPPPEPGSFYHVDLVGLDVVNTGGARLGRVERVIAGPAQDVLAVGGERERLIPLVLGATVVEVDLAAGRLVVDWAEDW